ncbi:unnamed protein product [Toxocara canis]|uniref:HMG box domain-containing protein n=1 Tax=Toxocara canis TaxID=6265 RepID=A0A183UDX5_TOXCA|nr:unnamed protein product [Toxocara canis]
MSIIGRRWNALSDEQKRPFLEKAEAERVEYEKQMEAYRKTDAYKQFTEKKEEILKKRRRKLKSGEPDSDDENEKLMGRTQAADLPIFSAQFLEYNKTQEAALKKLRQKSSSLEEENRLLKEIISRLKANIVAKKREYQKESGRAQEVLRTKEKWTSLIVAALNGVVVSGAPPVAKNIYAYMERLNYLTMEDPQHPILIKVRMALAGSSFL